jgi:hypothetical protein
MAESSLTTLIDIGDDIHDEIEHGGGGRWSAFVDGKNGFFYGIPAHARRVVKFNPLDKSLTEIGPDFGDNEGKWYCGVRDNTGNIYCTPYLAFHILKIKTNDDTVETLDDVELPEPGRGLWQSGALATDDRIYFMPYDAHRIMRLNPDNDTLSSVGDDLGGEGGKYSGTVVGNDDCLYGIPEDATRIVKYNPADPDTTSTVGKEVEGGFCCSGNGVLGGDGYIYAANDAGQVLKVDTVNNNYTWIGDRISSGRAQAWVDAIIGVDKCMYWPPQNANRVLKFDPETQQLPSLVGDDLGEGHWKWRSGALAATEGVIYCIPHGSTQILAIDPFKELSMTLHNNFRQHPQELGRLFVKDDEEYDETFYKSAIRKFGIEKVFELIEECAPLDVEWTDTRSNALPLFMVAASCENCAASVIYYFLRRNVHACIVGK